MEEVLQAARDIAADLIVMGSHGHGSVYNLLVGSVTEGILKAGRTSSLCSFLRLPGTNSYLATCVGPLSPKFFVMLARKPLFIPSFHRYDWLGERVAFAFRNRFQRARQV